MVDQSALALRLLANCWLDSWQLEPEFVKPEENPRRLQNLQLRITGIFFNLSRIFQGV